MFVCFFFNQVQKKNTPKKIYQYDDDQQKRTIQNKNVQVLLTEVCTERERDSEREGGRERERDAHVDRGMHTFAS